MNAKIINGEAVFQGVITQIFNPLYQLITALAVVYFLFGVAKFIYDINNPEKKTDGKNHLLWGLFGLFIILSLGGILPFFISIFGGAFK